MAKRKMTTNLAAAARILGKKGGKVGGPARKAALTSAQRIAIAKKGAKARHGK